MQAVQPVFRHPSWRPSQKSGMKDYWQLDLDQMYRATRHDAKRY